MSNVDRRLTALEERLGSVGMSMREAQERARDFYTKLHKIYGQGTSPAEESITELAELMAVGKDGEWFEQQLARVYRRNEANAQP